LKKLVYIGNNLDAKNPTTMVLLSALFVEIGFEVKTYSNKKNKLARLLAMCFGVVKHKNANCLIIDTYSTSNFYFAVITSQIARIFNLKYIPILHGGNLPQRINKSPFSSNLVFKHSKVNIAPSNYLLEKFQQKGFHTQFISNAIVLNNYPFKLRSALEPKILWVRAFDKIYNPKMAIKVLVLIRNRYPNASLCMVGPDKDGSLEAVKKEAEKYGIQDAIEFTGLLDKKQWIDKSEAFDIFINTTTVDNTPVSVLEAMALGLPVVSTNVGGIPYLIDDSVTGILVENNNELAMSNAILKLLENQTVAQTITKKARTLVEGFDAPIVKQQWLKLLNEC
jgi:glycosyltransferase involved in cell wall biosynthesis